MQLKRIFTLFTILFFEAIGIPVVAALANLPILQPAMAQTVTQGLVGAVNIALPVQIKFLNKTAVALAVESPGSVTYDIDPNGSISSTTTQFPAYFFVLPAQQDLSLDYEVSVQGNQVLVQVQQSTGNSPTDGALKINRMGYVYVY